ncbi:MAG: hypothetical protein M3N30_05445 [Bacteroidota bacterium]|nr:hypothetical protein [Bacteroidota bacterium]
MKLRIFLILFGLSATFSSNGQANNLKLDSIEKNSFNSLAYYISVDTQRVKIAEYEKNRISHIGEEHQLYSPVARGAAAEGPEGGSWDKFLPSVYIKDATEGSPFLVSIYVQGLVVDQYDSIINKTNYLYNYDKVSGNLLLKRNNEDPIAVNRSQVKMFCLKLDKGGYIFMKVPLINSNEFFQIIAIGPKYSCFKLYKNIFIKANQKSTNGYVPDGKNYDEYQDVITYYMVDNKKAESYIFELTKKSIKKALNSQTLIVEKYFKEHKYEDYSESFVSKRVSTLNN